ncbi:aspartate/glutamate racemase family protein [Labrys monachus]|uniref:Asp/Glu/hydantoin racemase n=1 Tax=Labrys monachus TaxID=217067 RepID=A0ABU0FJ04_9HYPH|nr:aspartate/glutamate racemase family protein [Labrys monachus]MDQ0394471.1 Asp/Glu/hydantoin racemase [Labrys monachus]
MPASDAVARIAMIHALEESVAPAREAFAQGWPEAFAYDLLDTSLAVDRADAGRLDDGMVARFHTLADYVAAHGGRGGRTAGILFTCSAFGPAIDAVKARAAIPVLRPNEAAFETALRAGDRIGLVVSFEPSRLSLEQELHAMAAAQGREVTVVSAVAAGALEALKAGDGERHDALVAEAAAGLGEVDAVVLGQFSLARAHGRTALATAAPVITTPGSAVAALRAAVLARRALPEGQDPHRA